MKKAIGFIDNVPFIKKLIFDFYFIANLTYIAQI